MGCSALCPIFFPLTGEKSLNLHCHTACPSLSDQHMSSAEETLSIILQVSNLKGGKSIELTAASYTIKKAQRWREGEAGARK